MPTMSELLHSTPVPVSVLALAALAGAALGLTFFGGLWWTTRLGAVSHRPALWFSASLLLRMGIALPGLIWVAGDRWERMLACLAGFLVARTLVTWATRPARHRRADATMEAPHAP
jgi:F1F0 ATPase subunit 2